MCARWRSSADTGDFGHAYDLHEEDVISWVEKSLSYIKNQLNYGLTISPYTNTNDDISFFEAV